MSMKAESIEWEGDFEEASIPMEGKFLRRELQLICFHAIARLTIKTV